MYSEKEIGGTYISTIGFKTPRLPYDAEYDIWYPASGRRYPISYRVPSKSRVVAVRFFVPTTDGSIYNAYIPASRGYVVRPNIGIHIHKEFEAKVDRLLDDFVDPLQYEYTWVGPYPLRKVSDVHYKKSVLNSSRIYRELKRDFNIRSMAFYATTFKCPHALFQAEKVTLVPDSYNVDGTSVAVCGKCSTQDGLFSAVLDGWHMVSLTTMKWRRSLEIQGEESEKWPQMPKLQRGG